MAVEKTTLCVPAKARYMVNVRLLASSVAGLAGFDMDKIEDIKTAVAEACLMLLPSAEEGDTLMLELWEEDGLMVKVTGPRVKEDLELTPEQEIGAFLLSALVDEVSCTSEETCTVYHLGCKQESMI